MKHLKYIIIILMLFTTTYGFAQPNSEYYYYYKGQKYFLQYGMQQIGITIEGNHDPAYLKSVFAPGGESSQVQESFARNSVKPTDQAALNRKNIKTWYMEITSRNTPDAGTYRRTLQTLGEHPMVLTATPCFISKEGQKMGLSNNFYVKLKNPDQVDALYQAAKKYQVEVLGYNEYMPLWFTLSCTKAGKMNALQAANLFYESGIYDAAEPELLFHDLLASNDTYFNNQWGLKNTGQWGASGVGIDIKAEQAWAITTGSANIRTAIFDQGVELNHPDLQANIFGGGYDAETNTTPSVVRGSHGTPCAGITGAVQNNGIGVSGVAPGTRLMSVSISLQFSNTPQQLANGFNWAWQNGAAVISNSWGGYAPSTIIEDGINNALNNGRGGLGTVVVFAAGNENNTVIRYPGGAIPRIIVVGALSPCGERKNPSSCDGEGWGSCFGTQLDVMGPGVKIPSTVLGASYTQTFNGTSSACPAVAGVAALVLSANPNLTVQQVTDIMEQTSQKVRTDLYSYTTTGGRPNGTWNNQMGYGLVNAHQAVLAAQALNCAANITVTAPVVAPNIDTRQASSNITALNIINNGARGIYHAGGSVLLNPGFRADFGSGFKAYIEGCTGSFIYRANTNETIVYNFRSANPLVNTEKAIEGKSNLLVTPNPFSNKVTIRYQFTKDDNNAIIEIYSATGAKMAGVTLSAKAPNSVENMVFDTEGFSAGIYFMKVINAKGQVTSLKLVKE
jgi:subtilisin family serine protease